MLAILYPSLCYFSFIFLLFKISSTLQDNFLSLQRFNYKRVITSDTKFSPNYHLALCRMGHFPYLPGSCPSFCYLMSPISLITPTGHATPRHVIISMMSWFGELFMIVFVVPPDVSLYSGLCRLCFIPSHPFVLWCFVPFVSTSTLLLFPVFCFLLFYVACFLE